MTQQACLQTELLHIQQDWNGYRAFQVLTTHQCWNEPGPIEKDTFREKAIMFVLVCSKST